MLQADISDVEMYRNNAVILIFCWRETFALSLCLALFWVGLVFLFEDMCQVAALKKPLIH